MGKKEQNQARTDIKSEKARTQAQSDSFVGGLGPERAQARGRIDAGYQDLGQRYGNLATTGGIDPSKLNSLRSGFSDMSVTGGFNPATANRIGAGYQQFSQTGGYTPGQLADTRARSNAVVPSYFNTLKEQVGRQQRMQGGYSPGATATIAKLGRNAAQAGAEQSRNTELDLGDRVRAGKLQGLSGEQGLQESLRTGKAAGLAGGQGLEESVRAGQLGGIGGLQQLMGLAMNESGQIDSNKLAAMGLNNQQIAHMMDMQKQLSMTPGVFDNIIKGVGAGAGLLTGIGGLTAPRPAVK